MLIYTPMATAQTCSRALVEDRSESLPIRMACVLLVLRLLYVEWHRFSLGLDETSDDGTPLGVRKRLLVYT
jgi:hypothetical protein